MLSGDNFTLLEELKKWITRFLFNKRHNLLVVNTYLSIIKTVAPTPRRFLSMKPDFASIVYRESDAG